MATTAGDIYVRSGNSGAFTEAQYVQGGWITVVSGSDMHSLDESRVADGQVIYVQELSQTYIVSKFEAFVTPGYSGFVNSRSFASFNFPGSGGAAADLTALNSFSSSILTYTGSTDTRLTSIESVTSSLLSYTGSINTRLSAIETYTSSVDPTTLATTGSNTFTGNQTVNGVLILTSQSSVPSPVDGGLYFDSNYNLFIGQ
jgi:hypothetical protein